MAIREIKLNTAQIKIIAEALESFYTDQSLYGDDPMVQELGTLSQNFRKWANE